MGSGVLTGLVCLFYITLLPTVSADYCAGYWDGNDNYHDVHQCGSRFCCGNCMNKYCCLDAKSRLSENDQDSCPGRSGSPQGNLALDLGRIVGGLSNIIMWGTLIICCACPCCYLHKICSKCCCYLHKICCKCWNRRPQAVINDHIMVVTTPQQPPAFLGHPQFHQGPQDPGYQSVPVQPGHEGQCGPQYYGVQAMPNPPPSYQEVAGPGYNPAQMLPGQAKFIQGQPVYPLQPPAQPSSPSPQSDDHAQPPYNPSYYDGPK
ncbi:protein shisa-5-like [Polymixia lowei]